MPEYSNSKIYKITSPSTEKIYIGSTTQSLSYRLQNHIKIYKLYIDDNTKEYSSSNEILAYGDYEIILIAQFNFNNISELKKKKDEYIKVNINICVNNTVSEERQQFFDDKKRNIAEYKKQYYANDNKESIADYKKQYYNDNKTNISQYLSKKNKQNYGSNKKEEMAVKARIYRDNKKNYLMWLEIKDYERGLLFKNLPFYNN